METYADRKTKLAEREKLSLEKEIFDGRYNDFLSNYADAGKDAVGRSGGKNIPYIGWYWRNIDWFDRYIPIGNCGDFIGFMANNKWDYPERNLTEDEATQVINLIDEAMHTNNQGGNLADIIKAREAVLQKLWDYMQTLEVKSEETN